MSLAEIREVVVRLSPADRQKLICFLAELTEAENEAYYQDIDRRMAAMDKGDRVTQEEAEARHQDLLRQGR